MTPTSPAHSHPRTARPPGLNRTRFEWRWLEWLLIIGVVVADQWTKILVLEFVPLHGKTVVIPNLLDLTHVRNTGAAFGFLNAVEFPFKSVVIAMVATTALLGIAFYASTLAREDRFARVGLGLILGGAIGNLADRARLGYVIDFVDVYWGEYHFWAFNVADSAITVGAALLILDMILIRHHVPKTV